MTGRPAGPDGGPTARGGALGDLRVVEFGEHIAVPFAGKLLAGLGAEVVKIEPPFVGDVSRTIGPFPGDVPEPDSSGLFQFLNMGKLGITLDVEQPSGTSLFEALIADADVVLDGQAPDYWDGLRARDGRDPRAATRGTVVSVSPFGQSGPYREYRSADLVNSAAAGVVYATGSPTREPIPLPFGQSHYIAGLNAAIAVLLGSFSRQRRAGPGPRVDVAEAEAFATFLSGVGVQSFVSEGRSRIRMGHRSGHSPHLNATLPCKDGYVTFDTPQKRQWLRLLDVIGHPEYAADAAAFDPLSPDLPAKVERLLEPWLMAHTKEEIFEICHRARIPAAPVNTVADVFLAEHLRARDVFETAGSSAFPRLPFRLSETPTAVATTAPSLGQHNEEIFCGRLGLAPHDLARHRQARVI